MGRIAVNEDGTVLSISIHPSRVGWDVVGGVFSNDEVEFQSTHPVWDGTAARSAQKRAPPNFNPPIPCGMGQATVPPLFPA